jgi:nucleotide-binding universal stress UspA family protein
MKAAPVSTPGEETIMPHVPTLVFSPAKILVPTDFSASSHAALQMATDLAKIYNAEIFLLHVVPMFPTGEGTEYFPETQYLNYGRGHAERRLTAHVAELTSRGTRACFAVEVGNDVVANIMMVIEREHVDMVVLSTHGLSGWRPVVFGSIAEKVIKLVQCPLLLFHSGAETAMLEQFQVAQELTNTAAISNS